MHTVMPVTQPEGALVSRECRGDTPLRLPGTERLSSPVADIPTGFHCVLHGVSVSANALQGFANDS
jgi:hypothetical protein